MRIPYRANPELYNDYFKNQVGHGMPVYIGRGGLGNVLSGLFRSVVPLMKRGGKALLKEGVRTAVQVGSDVLDGKNIKAAMKNRAAETGKRILRGTVRHFDEDMDTSMRKRVARGPPARGPPGKRARKSSIKRGRAVSSSQRQPDIFT